MKIVFLDVDGPMIPHRAYMLPYNHGGRVSLFDPIAVNMVKRLLALAPAKLVISSTWRGMGRDNIMHLLGMNGFRADCLHDDWATTPRNTSLPREEEIRQWLDRHPETTHYAALDDEDLGDLPGAVVCTFEDGLQMEHYKLAGRLLDIDEKTLHLGKLNARDQAA